ncbi:unnamed protein product, partial [Darwinula stevensoni]
ASRNLFVTLGDVDRSTSAEARSIEIPAESIFHPHFDAMTYKNNIALLKLKTPVDFDAYPNVRPICISSDASPSPGTSVTIAGWGGSDFYAPNAMKLNEATVQVIGLSDCKVWYNAMDDNSICARSTQSNICFGDAGGPMMYLTPAGYYQNVGVASFPKTVQCPAHYGAVYTRTANYVEDFIESNTQDAKWCPTP